MLESRLQPPYERTSSGLGSDNAPGLPRLAEATFTGAYPFARITFADPQLPAEVRLEAFNPLVPLDVDASGWPVAILRYTIRNANNAPARVGIAWSIENPVGKEGGRRASSREAAGGRQAAFREAPGLSGLYMDDPFLAASHPLKGTFALCAMGAPEGSVSYLRGWKGARWWDGVLAFWDDFSADGALDSSSSPGGTPVGSLAVTQTIPAGREATVTFLLAWHFPNRTPERCGWHGSRKACPRPPWWATPIPSALRMPGTPAAKPPSNSPNSKRARARSPRPSSRPRCRRRCWMRLPARFPPCASTPASARADGEFHGFEGCNDHQGCCHGNCTHVWNYELATAVLFPKLAHSLRESEFLRNTDTNGLMGFRSYLPDGKQISQVAAADGQMGCLIKLYREWKLSGDTDWLRRLWPSAKRALEFAWMENGWDGNRDGVAEGVQHNTYDVEFYGPNPLCGIYYLGALRAGEEMARVVGDQDSAAEYHRLFANGSRWIDQNLFNGEYYIQKVEGRPAEQIAPGLRRGSGAANTLAPDYQMGGACLVDQLLGQCHAYITGLGYLLEEAHVRTALKSTYKYNYRPNLSEHVDLQRTYALNDEGGVVVATYPSGKRPEIPFPYFGEIWTGLEYQFAASLAFEGMMTEALNVVESVRRRFDGERRNPWNEPECGHHYARAMASWGCYVAWSGFRYSAPDRELTLMPRTRRQAFRCFWSVPSGWGSFTHTLKPQGTGRGSPGDRGHHRRGAPGREWPQQRANLIRFRRDWGRKCCRRA